MINCKWGSYWFLATLVYKKHTSKTITINLKFKCMFKCVTFNLTNSDCNKTNYLHVNQQFISKRVFETFTQHT